MQPTPPSPPDPVLLSSQDPVAMQLQALTSQEIESVSKLVRLEGDRVAINRQLADATGEQRAMLSRQLTMQESMIDGERAKIADIKQRIVELARQSPHTSFGVNFGSVPPGDRMFGLSRSEFNAAFAFVIMFPLVIALSRMIWRRGVRPQPSLDEGSRFTRLEQAVEAVAIEVERIGESQRFQTRLMSERAPDRAPSEIRK